MPLSEHEQRILADIEARLRADDPRFADAVASETVASQQRTRLRWSVVAFLAGFVLLFVGLSSGVLWGLLGFGLMLGAVYQAMLAVKRLAEQQSSSGDGAGGSALQRYRDAARRRDDDAG